MREYTLITLKKQSAEYVRISNVPDAVRSIKLLYKLLSSYRDRDLFITLSNIYDRVFWKKNMPGCRCGTIVLFRAGSDRLWNQGTPINISNGEKEAPQGNILEAFLLDTFKTILNGKFNPIMGTIRAFFQKSGHFFNFYKGHRRLPSSP